MIRVAIVDDEPLARRRIRTLLRGEPDVTIIAECRNGREATNVLRQEVPDLVFLDIQMPEIDGFGVIEALDKKRLPVIVFVTAYDQHAIRAFEVHALDYLLKPFDDERFRKSLDHARAVLQSGPRSGDQLLALLAELSSLKHDEDRIAVKKGERTQLILVTDIDWIESTGNYVTLHVGKEKHLLRETMKLIEDRLDRRIFRRVHRCAIVNVRRVKQLKSLLHGDYELVLHDGHSLTVSRRYRRNLDGVL